ncbi:anthranilate synthase component I family protein [Nannocystaceae bacterium ST9]
MSTPALFPVSRELLCDGETPVGAFARLRRAFTGQHCFLLESVVGGERWARYSMIGVGHRLCVTGRWLAGQLRVRFAPGPGFDAIDEIGERGSFGEGSGSALIQRLLDRYRAAPAPDLPRFWGGLVGVWGHDMARDVERVPLPERMRAELDLPAFELLVSDTLVIFDNLAQKVRVVATACPREDGGEIESRARAERRIDAVIAAFNASEPLEGLQLDEQTVVGEALLAPAWQREGGAGRFREHVVEAKQHIAAGDVFQLVLSQRFDQPRDHLDPLDVYRMLRVTNPAPYMYLLELPSASLAGASPEVLVRVDVDRRVTLRPIAGTRPRGDTPELDLALEHELLADPKERAEHLMLIDLGRNDLGRVAEPGTVALVESFVIERYSKVMHIVSEVVGELGEGLTALDALRSTFPAGTLSGAPKVRALELIDELEPAPRGWYGGAVGYLGFDGAADFAICIRSVVFTGDSLRVQAGAGIVHDSDPAAEDEECRRKASAVLRAIAMARLGRAARTTP